MAAVIQRVVASPQVKTEYLSSFHGVEVWGPKKKAHVFKTHALADELAAKLRLKTAAERREKGEITAAFIHARTLENSEWDDFSNRNNLSGGRSQKKPSVEGGAPTVAASGTATPAQKDSEFHVEMDPKRAAEVLRDPAEAY